jgi:hypothetical protein
MHGATPHRGQAATKRPEIVARLRVTRRSGNQLGVAFRRQVRIDNRHIVDFSAPSLKLVVEVDGGSHARNVLALPAHFRYEPCHEVLAAYNPAPRFLWPMVQPLPSAIEWGRVGWSEREATHGQPAVACVACDARLVRGLHG